MPISWRLVHRPVSPLAQDPKIPRRVKGRRMLLGEAWRDLAVQEPWVWLCPKISGAQIVGVRLKSTKQGKHPQYRSIRGDPGQHAAPETDCFPRDGSMEAKLPRGIWLATLRWGSNDLMRQIVWL